MWLNMFSHIDCMCVVVFSVFCEYYVMTVAYGRRSTHRTLSWYLFACLLSNFHGCQWSVTVHVRV
jgi:hypothetical protein